MYANNDFPSFAATFRETRANVPVSFFPRLDTTTHIMFFSQPAHLAKAQELKESPPKGMPYSVAIPGTEQPGRTPVYRAWNAQKELLSTLDPQVCGKAECDKQEETR